MWWAALWIVAVRLSVRPVVPVSAEGKVVGCIEFKLNLVEIFPIALIRDYQFWVECWLCGLGRLAGLRVERIE